MKAYTSIVALLFILGSILIVSGCKYDAAEPLWDKPPATGAPTPAITGVVPVDSATPGINTITIQGQNFNDSLSGNIVYFDSYLAEIMSSTNSSITVRRPNWTTNSASIKVVSNGALLVAKYPSPYKINAVSQKYGSFLDNVSLSGIAVDSVDNIYVEETATFKVFKVTPGGVKTVVGTAPWNPLDMRVGPDGNIYFCAGGASGRELAMLNVATGVTTARWRWLAQGRLANTIDFGNNGFIYIGGSTDLYILSLATAASSAGITTPIVSGLYPGSSLILSLRVFNGYVYVAVKPGKIYKHKINSDGNLGPQILVLDWTATRFSAMSIKKFTVAADLTTLYIQTNDPAESFFVSTAQGVDFFYKDILRPYGVFLDWSRTSNYLYSINGNTTPAEEWNVYRVDMGAKSAVR